MPPYSRGETTECRLYWAIGSVICYRPSAIRKRQSLPCDLVPKSEGYRGTRPTKFLLSHRSRWGGPAHLRVFLLRMDLHTSDSQRTLLRPNSPPHPNTSAQPLQVFWPGTRSTSGVTLRFFPPPHLWRLLYRTLLNTSANIRKDQIQYFRYPFRLHRRDLHPKRVSKLEYSKVGNSAQLSSEFPNTWPSADAIRDLSLGN